MADILNKPNFEGTGDKLCFDRNEFLKNNFSVDEFLHKNRNVPSLELLRDDLGIYLKVLRASMIDLINEDYADFVSLSANLVGLDQSIDTIQKPLEEFRDEISDIQATIDENIHEIRSRLESKRQLRELKRNLQSLKKVYESINKLEDLLSKQLNEEQLKAVDLERAALELVQLKFNEKFCTEYLDEENKSQIHNLESAVHEKLRKLFNDTLKTTHSTCSEPLERCLRIYITLDACNMAETVFKEDVVAPYMAEIISEHNLQQTPHGVAGIYSKILNFISLHMTDLLRLTQYTDKLRGFNFLLHSFWSDVEMRLETHMTSIFAPGNSEIFYGKYKCTRDFLGKIEELLANKESIAKFRQDKQTKSFKNRWNLPVYFQICFQEIAGQFESALEPVYNTEMLKPGKKSQQQYQMMPFLKAQTAIERCWSEGVYLAEVFPKFYKLHIQILLRLSKWIEDLIKLINEASPLSTSSSSSNHLNKQQILVALYSDITKLLQLLPNQKQELVLKNIPSNLVPQAAQLQLLKDTVEKSFKDLEQQLSQHLIAIKKSLIKDIVGESATDNIRQVNDLPRLYRKTNRDVPTRCSTYVEQMLKPFRMFNNAYESQLGKPVVSEIIAEVLNKLTADYSLVINDVLTSVQKTEESLRRLRNLKGGGTGNTSSSATMSDDDKIRLQLRVDVAYFTNELSAMGLEPCSELLQLNSTVEESVRIK